MFAAVAFDPAFDCNEKIGPHGLRAKIAAPYTSGDGIHQEQSHCREDKKAGQVVDFLRPNLNEEEIKAPGRKVDQDCLIRCVRSAIPSREWEEIVDRESDDEHRPFHPAECARYMLRVDFSARRIKRLVVELIFGVVRFARYLAGAPTLGILDKISERTGRLCPGCGSDGGRRDVTGTHSSLPAPERMDIDCERLDCHGV